MPKFNLYPHPYPGGADADSRIEVGWQKSPTGSVQIATTKLQPGADRHHEYYERPGQPGEHYRSWDGQYIDLDRNQINHLIRQLREARDGAFGRDE